MGFIGMGRIADSHPRSFPGMKNIQPIAVCDVRDNLIDQALVRFNPQVNPAYHKTDHHHSRFLARRELHAETSTQVTQLGN